MKLHNLQRKSITVLGIVFLCFCLIMSACSTAIETDNSKTFEPSGKTVHGSNFELICENELLALYGNDSGDHAGNFAVKNKADGNVWYSSPLEASNDAVAINIMKLQSVMVIEYYNPTTDSLVEMNSCLDSVNKGGLTIKTENNSAYFVFEFPAVSITVPLKITLCDDGSLKVKVDIENVKEDGEFKLFTVSILPYFCSSSIDDNGFLFVPDGSGAIMNFNNGKINYAAYSQAIYGGDYGKISEEEKVVSEQIKMPVYGMSKSDCGIFTIVTEGAAQSNISAVTSGVDSGYNAVWNNFEIRKVTTYSLDQGWQGKKTFNVFQESKPTIKTIENTYYFLTAENADLGGMAQCYREYLINDGFVSDTNKAPSVYVDYLGAVESEKSVLGFPSTVKNVITDFNDAKEITEGLLNSDVDNLVVRYLNWNNQSITGKIVNKSTADSKLGGKKDFEDLVDYLKENNVEFYPDVNLTTYSKNNYLFQQFYSATRNLNKEINKYYPYKINLYTQDKDRNPYYLLSLTKLPETSAKFLNSYAKYGHNGLSLSGICSYVTADFNSKKTYFDTSDCEKIYLDIINQAAKENSLLLDSANMSSAVYADHIVNTAGSSGYDMLDYRVPFYQMALSGLVNYAGEAINLSADSREAFLRAIESGSGLHYSLTYNSSTKNIKDTEYEHWIGTDYKDWTPIIAEQYSEMCRVYEMLESNRPVSYEIAERGIVNVRFESGNTLIVNYDKETVNYNGIALEAYGYAVLKGGNLVGQSE